MHYYLLKEDGSREGPFTGSQLIEMARNSQVLQTTVLYQEGSPEGIQASAIPELVGAWDAPNSNPPPVIPPDQTVANTYDFMATKVGFVPNVKLDDNIFQLKFIGIFCLVSAAICIIWKPFGEEAPFYMNILLGVIAGLLPGLLISGIIIGIRSLFRK